MKRPYLFSCLTSEGDIDWARMNVVLEEFGRSSEERKAAVLKSSLKDDLSNPRIWVPIYGENTSIFAQVSIH